VTVEVVSWNVNGLRSVAKKGFADYLASTRADVVCLQETRVLIEQLEDDVRNIEGWTFHLTPAVRKGYSGVGVYSRVPPLAVEDGIGNPEFDDEGRVQILRYADWTLVNGYFPNGNGKNRDLSRIPYKLAFYDALYAKLEDDKAAGRPILVVGDWNTAHQPVDLARPKDNVKTSGFRPEERDALTRWLDGGWVDTFRAKHPDATERYSWWSNRVGVREKNIGWRIDYILASPGAWPHVAEAGIADDVMGSDHCPVWVRLDIPAL
jgi:exodeoxyribonuclease III